MHSDQRLTIAIDGPAGAGKSTAARGVAQRLGYLYIDTGAMYRAVALQALKAGIDLSDDAALAALARQVELRLATDGDTTRVWVDGAEVTSEIRKPDVTEAASRVSAVPGVREAMVRLQRQWGRGGGVVMEGRDIGTVVFPDAEVKVYLEASPEKRALRRAAELAEQGLAQPVTAVGAQIAARDARDSQRAASPLIPAPDAVRLNTDALPAEGVIQQIVAICRQRGAAR